MTRESYAPATLSNTPPSKALLEDATQEKIVAKWLATLDEDPLEEPNQNNNVVNMFL